MVRRLSKCARNPIWTSCFRYTALENDVWSLQTNPATKVVTCEQTPGKYLLDTSPKSNQNVLSLTIQINAGAYLLFTTWNDLRVFLIIPDEIGVNHGFLTPHPPHPHFVRFGNNSNANSSMEITMSEESVLPQEHITMTQSELLPRPRSNKLPSLLNVTVAK